jgi:threonine/homoserine/homoserine lactone efflux protein
MLFLFLKGLAFGFVLAAAVGPMWLLCFRRTMAHGALAGLVSGMGIAVADGLYGAVAAFGLTAISGFLLAQPFWIALAGSLFLVFLGAKTLIVKPAAAAAPARAPDARGHAAAFVTTLGLTLANPPTIIAFAAVFASLGLAAGAGYGAAAWVTLGVFLGSASWWAILAGAAARLRARLGERFLRAVNLVSGLTLLGFALWQLARLFR